MYITSSKFGLFGCFVNRPQKTDQVGRVGLACRLCLVGSWQLAHDKILFQVKYAKNFVFGGSTGRILLYQIGGLFIMSSIQFFQKDKYTYVPYEYIPTFDAMLLSLNFLGNNTSLGIFLTSAFYGAEIHCYHSFQIVFVYYHPL